MIGGDGYAIGDSGKEASGLVVDISDLHGGKVAGAVSPWVLAGAQVVGWTLIGTAPVGLKSGKKKAGIQ